MDLLNNTTNNFKMHMTNTNNTFLQNLQTEAKKSPVRAQHAATITKGRKPIFTEHNSKRTSYHLHHKKVLNCSMHAEMAALQRLLRCSLKARKKGWCVL